MKDRINQLTESRIKLIEFDAKLKNLNAELDLLNSLSFYTLGIASILLISLLWMTKM